jgi:hypothetical protein
MLRPVGSLAGENAALSRKYGERRARKVGHGARQTRVVPSHRERPRDPLSGSPRRGFAAVRYTVSCTGSMAFLGISGGPRPPSGPVFCFLFPPSPQPHLECQAPHLPINQISNTPARTAVHARTATPSPPARTVVHAHTPPHRRRQPAAAVHTRTSQ